MQFLLENDGLELEPKDDFQPKRKKIKKFVDMTEEEQQAAIAEDPRYGHVICRCETITEAEIVRAIHTEPQARSVDAIKRRLRAAAMNISPTHESHPRLSSYPVQIPH